MSSTDMAPEGDVLFRRIDDEDIDDEKGTLVSTELESSL